MSGLLEGDLIKIVQQCSLNTLIIGNIEILDEPNHIFGTSSLLTVRRPAMMKPTTPKIKDQRKMIRGE